MASPEAYDGSGAYATVCLTPAGTHAAQHRAQSRKGQELLQQWPHVAAPRHLLVDGLKRGRATAVVETPEQPDNNL